MAQIDLTRGNPVLQVAISPVNLTQPMQLFNSTQLTPHGNVEIAGNTQIGSEIARECTSSASPPVSLQMGSLPLQVIVFDEFEAQLWFFILFCSLIRLTWRLCRIREELFMSRHR